MLMRKPEPLGLRASFQIAKSSRKDNRLRWPCSGGGLKTWENGWSLLFGYFMGSTVGAGGELRSKMVERFTVHDCPWWIFRSVYSLASTSLASTNRLVMTNWDTRWHSSVAASSMCVDAMYVQSIVNYIWNLSTEYKNEYILLLFWHYPPYMISRYNDELPFLHCD